MSHFIPPSLESEGSKSWLTKQKIDYDKFILLLDSGMRPAGLARAFKKSRGTTVRYLEQIASERGLKHWKDLYA